MKAYDLHAKLETSDGKTPVLLDIHFGVKIQAARNKYKNGFAISVVGKSGKYSVDGCQHYQGFDLLMAISRAKDYIEKWSIT